VGEEEKWRDRSTEQKELALEVEEEAAEAAVVAPPALSLSLRPPFVSPFFWVYIYIDIINYTHTRTQKRE